MKIVVLDGYTLNPGDLSWDSLERLGEVKVYDRTPADRILERAKDAAIVLTNKTPLTAETIAALPKLQYVGVLATGYNVVDTREASERGIVVTNVPAYGSGAVAQFAFALLLELCHRIGMHDEAVKRGEWNSRDDFCFTLSTQIELEGKTLGIVGLGRIGMRVADIAKACGMRVVATGSRRSGRADVDGIEWRSLPELLAESDVISLHCPLTPDTEGLIDRDRIKLMKKTALLINTSRGGLVVEQDLADALNEGSIGGAAVDVLQAEPPEAGHPLLHARNCLITPHMAWATREARARLLHIAVQNLEAYQQGHVQNAVI